MRAEEQLKKIYHRQNTWLQNNRDRQTVTLPQGTKARIKAQGRTVNGLINELVLKWLEEQENNK